MFRLRHACAVFLVAVFLIAGVISAAAPQDTSRSTGTAVTLRWGKQPGVARYRLQIARDQAFTDVVLDRIVNGNEVQIDTLDQGRYFWRVAPLDGTRGEFSSPAVIEVRPTSDPNAPRKDPSPIVVGDGWLAAVGDVSRMVPARLRSASQFDIVAMNAQGVTFGLNSTTGVSIWSKRSASTRRPLPAIDPVVVPGGSGLESVIIFDGEYAVHVEGQSGREVWRSTTPSGVAAAAITRDGTHSYAIILDSSLRRLFVLDAAEGKLLGDIKLTGPIVPAVVPVENRPRGEFLIAYENGQIETRNSSGGVIRTGSVAGAPTTQPLLVRGNRGMLVLIGTREGLAALTADELRGLGMVTLREDTPRGRLFAADLDGDGVEEVAMLTARRRLVVVKAADGTILWISNAQEDVQALAFADLNNDRVLDVFVSGRETNTIALSGRDGSTIWKDAEPSVAAANHATGAATRKLLILPHGSGALLISNESSRTGVRAIALSNATVPPRLP
jgi:outer membrane protein assembly factor BamB